MRARKKKIKNHNNSQLPAAILQYIYKYNIEIERDNMNELLKATH